MDGEAGEAGGQTLWMEQTETLCIKMSITCQTQAIQMEPGSRNPRLSGAPTLSPPSVVSHLLESYLVRYEH